MFKVIIQRISLKLLIFVVFISFSLPGILYRLNFDICKITDVESISIISGFISSALAILITNTNLPKDKEKNIRDSYEYAQHLRIKQSPQTIYKNQKEFLLWSILLQIILILITVLLTSLSNGMSNINCLKFIFDYLGLSFFFISSASILVITYHTIKHVSDFDIGIE